jgi:hypothetical protein
MNIHIELVKKWLADPDSVTQQELEDNADAAYAAYATDYAANATYAAAAYTSYAANYAADAANATTYAYNTNATYWVKSYEGLTK